MDNNYNNYHLLRPLPQQPPSYFFDHHLQIHDQQSVNGLENKEVVVNGDYSDDRVRDSYYPPGYKFCPTDEELVSHYLIKHMIMIDQEQPPTASKPSPTHTIPEVDIYKDSPQVITSKYPLGDVNKKEEWYFITPLTRKYPNGGRPSRACGDGVGFWKPTGKDKRIEVGEIVAKKKCLEFFQGKPPGKKTDWKMHEYRIIDHDDEDDQSAAPKNREKQKKLCDLSPALCRIYLNSRKKDNKMDDEDQEEDEDEGGGGGGGGGGSPAGKNENKEVKSESPDNNNYAVMLEGGDHANANPQYIFMNGEDESLFLHDHIDQYVQSSMGFVDDLCDDYQIGTHCNFSIEDLMMYSPVGNVSNFDDLAPPK